MSRPCYRNLDKPFTVFLGLAPVELVAIAVVGLVFMTVASVPVGLVGGLAFGLVVKCLREGKPRGYTFYLLYRSGLLGLLPDGIRPPGLAPHPGPFGPREEEMSPVPGEADDDSPEARHFWSGKRLLR